MSNDGSGRWFENPVPIVMVGLLTAGVLSKFAPLETARPSVEPDRLISHQDVPARLWQDPLAAIEKAEKENSGRYSNESRISLELSSPTDTFKVYRSSNPFDDDRHNLNDVQRKIEKHVTILAVNMLSSPFDADAEWRRRARFAVISALRFHKYVPEKPDALGYYKTRLPYAEQEGIRNIELVVPYEWFKLEKSPVSGGQEQADRAEDQAQRDRKVLVLWLNEDKLGVCAAE